MRRKRLWASASTYLVSHHVFMKARRRLKRKRHNCIACCEWCTVALMNETKPSDQTQTGGGATAERTPAPLLIGKDRKADNRIFGRLLRRYRIEQGKSAVEVADSASVTASFIRSIERGDQAPSRETADKILSALGVDPSEEVVLLTDPDTGERFEVRDFLAASKGDNSRWSMARLIDPADPAASVERMIHAYANSPTSIEESEREERFNSRRALGIYDISAEESIQSVRLRAIRRLVSATDDEVRRIHELEDNIGVNDPDDPIDDYLAQGYMSRQEMAERGKNAPDSV